MAILPETLQLPWSLTPFMVTHHKVTHATDRPASTYGVSLPSSLVCKWMQQRIEMSAASNTTKKQNDRLIFVKAAHT
jgi:hypothetical protein